MITTNEKLTYVFDIDGTICSLSDGDYKLVRPIYERIDIINQRIDIIKQKLDKVSNRIGIV